MSRFEELKRTTFETSRLLDYFSERELVAQTGHEQRLWPEMILKELADNALDACETAGVRPSVQATITDTSILVIDNGAGIPVETIRSAIDYSVRVSDKARYVSPTRGTQGNALKTVVAVPYVLDGAEGRIELTTHGQGYEIVVRTDQVRQVPRIELLNGRTPIVKTGTAFKVHWPHSACSKLAEPDRGFLQIARGFAFLNPHVDIRVECPCGTAAFKPTDASWSKWLPTWSTSPHWYSTDDLASLVAAYLTHDEQNGRKRTVREIVAEFAGLAGSAKQKAVVEAAGLGRASLSSLECEGMLNLDGIGRLLAAMQEESRPIKPTALGLIGEVHFRRRFGETGCEMETFRYARKLGTMDGLPYVIEAAFAYAPRYESREVIAGVNWSPAIGGIPFNALGDEWTLNGLLQEQRCGYEEPILLVTHLSTPKVLWQDRGKSSVSLQGELADDFTDAVRIVTKQWHKTRKSEERNSRQRSRRLERLTKPERFTFTDLADEVIPKAYSMASGEAGLATATQVMYVARRLFQEYTDKTLDRQYFNQTLLPDFISDHADLTAEWDVVYDARGRFHEPHTDRIVPLGTLAVREYLSELREFSESWTDSIQPGTITFTGCKTVGPKHRFGAVLFVEKEGFLPLFNKVQLAERYDLAVMSTKGVTVTAARRLLDGLAGYAREELGHPLPLLILHDFDKSGFTILGTFTRETRRYEYANELSVVDLGLRLADVKEMNLPAESVFVKGESPDLNLCENGATEAEIKFLVSGQRHHNGVSGQRVELNAMTSDQFVKWLEAKLVKAGVKKVVPSEDVLASAYRQLVAERELCKVVKQAEPQIIEAAKAAKTPNQLHRKVTSRLRANPAMSWDAVLSEIVAEGE